MQGLARRTTAHNGPVVWVLSSGDVLGVYATRDAAKGAFAEAAKNIPFDLDSAWQDEETGAIHAHGGCDWVSLVPHPLITAPQIH